MKVEITESIKYIGVDDHDIDLFESQYDVPEGVSYNSYLIMDEKVALMDTVDSRKTAEWEANLKAQLGDRKVDYIVVHHMEPDHSGSLLRALELFPEATIVGNAKTFTMMQQFLSVDISNFNQLSVVEGDTLSLGSHTLTFVFAPMVHWPEVMVSYDSKDKVLFSADGFGKFGALDAEDEEGWACEARRYYFNIVGKYGVQVQSLLKKAAGLDIQIICPLHGPILKEDLGYYLDIYNTWSSYTPETKGVMIAFASIHGNTAKVAHLIEDMLRERGVEKIEISDLSRDDMAEAIEGAFRYDRMILCASSYDAGVFAPMSDFLHHLQSKAFQSRKVALLENGSWGPTAAKTMRAELEAMKNITILDETVTIRSSMKDSDLPAITALVDAVVNA